MKSISFSDRELAWLFAVMFYAHLHLTLDNLATASTGGAAAFHSALEKIRRGHYEPS